MAANRDGVSYRASKLHFQLLQVGSETAGGSWSSWHCDVSDVTGVNIVLVPVEPHAAHHMSSNTDGCAL